MFAILVCSILEIVWIYVLVANWGELGNYVFLLIGFIIFFALVIWENIQNLK